MSTTAQFLFDRSWAVTVQVPGETAKKYTGLKVVFDIEKVSIATSNKAKIEVYNFSSGSRVSFQKKGLVIRLEAGYKGTTETLYLGDVVRVYTKRKGPDIITTFECGDAEKQLINAHFNQSYPAGTTYVSIIQDIAKALSVNFGVCIGFPDLKYNSGVTFSGAIRHILTDLLRKQSLEWSIHNNYLQIIPIRAYNGDEAAVLSASTGLIGVPSQKESGIECISLLNPKLLPGSGVEVVSDTINGFFKIRKAHFEGDSHGEKWQVTVEGVLINKTQSFPQNAGDHFVASGIA
jgi:hypothetical protein